MIDEYLYTNNVWGDKPWLFKIIGTSLSVTLI